MHRIVLTSGVLARALPVMIAADGSAAACTVTVDPLPTRTFSDTIGAGTESGPATPASTPCKPNKDAR